MGTTVPEATYRHGEGKELVRRGPKTVMVELGFFSQIRVSTVLMLFLIVALSYQARGQQQYMNEAHLFVITPPDGWITNEKATGVVVQFELRVQGVYTAGLNVGVIAAERAKLADLISQIKIVYPTMFQGFRLLSEGPIKVAGTEGYELIFTSTQSGVAFKGKQVITFRYDYKFYILSYVTAESNFDKYLSEADKSISTFSFAERLTIDADPRVTSVTLDTRSYSAKDLPKTTLIAIGQTCTLSVEHDVAGFSGTRYVFMKWSDGVKEASRKIAITKAESFRAEYKTQYLLTVESEYGAPQGGGWYDSGTAAAFSVSSPVPVSGFMGNLGAKMVFDRWSGDSAAQKESNSIVIDSPKKVIALWREDYTQAYVILGLAAAVSIVLAAVLLMRIRKSPPRSQPL